MANLRLVVQGLLALICGISCICAWYGAESINEFAFFSTTMLLSATLFLILSWIKE